MQISTYYNNAFSQVLLSNNFLFLPLALLGDDCPENIADVIEKLKQEFEVAELGPPQKYLGTEFLQNKENRTLFLCQKLYLLKLIQSRGDSRNSTSKLTPISNLTEEESFSLR